MRVLAATLLTLIVALVAACGKEKKADPFPPVPQPQDWYLCTCFTHNPPDPPEIGNMQCVRSEKDYQCIGTRSCQKVEPRACPQPSPTPAQANTGIVRSIQVSAAGQKCPSRGYVFVGTKGNDMPAAMLGFPPSESALCNLSMALVEVYNPMRDPRWKAPKVRMRWEALGNTSPDLCLGAGDQVVPINQVAPTTTSIDPTKLGYTVPLAFGTSSKPGTCRLTLRVDPTQLPPTHFDNGLGVQFFGPDGTPCPTSFGNLKPGEEAMVNPGQGIQLDFPYDPKGSGNHCFLSVVLRPKL